MESKYMKAEYIITIDGEPDFSGGYPLKEKRELVRCKDCRWRVNHGATSTKWLPCMDNRYNDDWFCADGERK